MRRSALTIAAALSFISLSGCGAGEEGDDEVTEESEDDEEGEEEEDED